MCEGMCTCMWMPMGAKKKTSDALELIGITGDYEPPNMGAGTWGYLEEQKAPLTAQSPL